MFFFPPGDLSSLRQASLGHRRQAHASHHHQRGHRRQPGPAYPRAQCAELFGKLGDSHGRGAGMEGIGAAGVT